MPMRIIRFIGCKTRLFHLHAVWKDDGIHCEDCGYFKDRYTHQADMHAGGGW